MGSKALAARLAKDDRREEWQRRLITWGAYYRAELMGLPDIAPAAPPPDWYASLRAAILSLPEEHQQVLTRVYVDAEARLPHRRALAALLAVVDQS